MVITTNQTIHPLQPQPPSMPVVSQEALKQLVDYYRQMADYHRSCVDYHQQLLEQHSHEASVVEKQLASIEAVLPTLTRESLSQEISHQTNGQQTYGTEKITSLKDQASDTVAETASATLNIAEVTKGGSQADKTSKNQPKKSATEADQSVAQASSQKKPQDEKNPPQAKRISSSAKKTQNLTPKKKTQKSQKSTKTHSSRMPHSDKLIQRESIVDAVGFCLQEYYPKVISAKDILKYYYPEGLKGESHKKAYAAFSNCLSKGAGKQGWLRASLGKYRWHDEG